MDFRLSIPATRQSQLEFQQFCFCPCIKYVSTANKVQFLNAKTQMQKGATNSVIRFFASLHPGAFALIFENECAKTIARCADLRRTRRSRCERDCLPDCTKSKTRFGD